MPALLITFLLLLTPPQLNTTCQDVELKILGLRSLCETDKARCEALAAEVIKSSAACPLPVRRATLPLLARHGGPEGLPALVQMARSEPDEKLRMEAIKYLGRTNDDRGLEVLRELALDAAYADESPTDSAIHALASHESPRAVQILGEVAARGRNLKARQHAVYFLSGRRGADAVDELLRLYDAVQDAEVRQSVVAGFGRRKDPRAAAKLLEIARAAPQADLRRQAIEAIPNRGEEADLDALLPLYDAERDEALKSHILRGIGHYKSRRAYQKLMQVVRSGAEPLERRKYAIGVLARSKDPEVLQFLEEVVK